MSQDTWSILHAVELSTILHYPTTNIPESPDLFDDEHRANLWKLVLSQANLLRSGSYEDVWTLPGAFDPRIPSQDEMSLKIVTNRLGFKLTAYLEGPEELERSPYKKDLFLLRASSAMMSTISLLYIYTQTNHTGPEFDASEATKSAYAPNEDVLEELSIDGERSFRFAKYPNLLYGARVILESLSTFSAYRQSIALSLWTGRCSILHMGLFEEVAPTLCEIAINSLDNTLHKIKIICDGSPTSAIGQYLRNNEQSEVSSPKNLGETAAFSELLARIHIEIGIFHRNNFNSDLAMKAFAEAKKARGIDIQMTGVLGIRMRYQTFQVSQLILKARPSLQAEDGAESAPYEQPLDHPDLLPAPKLESNDEEENLHPIDQSIILSLCLDVKSRNPSDALTNEEMMPYVRRVMKNPNNWMVHSMTLLIKSRLEGKRTKTVERSVLQIQALVDQHNDKDVSGHERLRFIFNLAYPNRWELKRELGHSFLNLGVARSALQQFQEYEMWTEIVQCYRVMEQERKAEEVVRKQLELRATPELWCILGELTNDESCFEKSWELSGHRYSKCQRFWARHLLLKGKYEECIPHFEIALKINPMFPMTWFSLGCAAMRVPGQLDKASNAFTRVIQQEPEDGEAWCNLASVFVKQEKLTEAWHALREALKHKRQSWKIWQNFMYISIDIGEYSQAVLAYDNILDLREKEGVDPKILSMLVTVAIDFHKKKHQGHERYVQSILTLLGKICSKVSTNAQVWDIYSRLHYELGNHEKGKDCLLRKYRALTVTGWDTDPALLQKVVDGLQQLTDAYLKHPVTAELKSLDTILRSALKRIEPTFKETAEHSRIQTMLNDLTQALQN